MKRFRLGFLLGLTVVFSLVTTSAADLTALSSDQLNGGLKEALLNGVQKAISQLGQTNGFLTNAAVKIPMPASLAKVEKTLRTLKQDALADQFVATMNHAAEAAVPEAASVLKDSVKQITLTDARALLTGTNTAATDFFRKTSTNALYEKFLPIVKKATAEAGVTSAYKRMMDKGRVGTFAGALLGQDSLNIDDYVTKKTLDGLFIVIAEEEKKIRANPAARGSELLKKVFGVLEK